MSINQQTINPPLCSLMALTLVVALGCFAEAGAQWTTPDANQNINNTNTGNVGIGTTSPGTSLDVAGNTINVGSEPGTKNRGNNTTKLARIAMPPYTSSNLRFALLGGATISNANIVAVGGEVGGMSAATQIDFFTASTTNVDTGTLRMTIDGTGKIGIGTASPTTAFQLNSAAAAYSSAGQLLITDSNNSNRHLRLGYDSSLEAGWIQASKVGTGYQPLLLNPNGANVAIGTATPNASYKLDVQGGSINSSGGLCIAGDCKTAWSQIGGSQWTTSGTTINYSNGNVGIATATPTEKLHVTGNVKVSGNIDVGGNINAKYQDVAEWVESSQELPAGTVVILDPTKPNQVIASTQPYDSRVAGVISLRPGVVLGDRGEGRVLVATTGRVKVKVDAGNGPIQIGDLLVTSDNEGMAMKSLPVEVAGVRLHRPGTLIGKALEPLDQGTGYILVLLSLQ